MQRVPPHRRGEGRRGDVDRGGGGERVSCRCPWAAGQMVMCRCLDAACINACSIQVHAPVFMGARRAACGAAGLSARRIIHTASGNPLARVSAARGIVATRSRLQSCGAFWRHFAAEVLAGRMTRLEYLHAIAHLSANVQA